ncbi:CDP-glycerol glycerophosphotransferase family protein [Corticicoccus populi]|uniref:CDP-glycerol glycerophosphotransferase family protein n=1 Tax=Corticicoccus populi TaxID=1812821 RepID=A0ABW5WZW9_9STAP
MKLIKKVIFKVYKMLFLLCEKSFYKDPTLIMFESFLGKQYSDNPRAIYEYMSVNYPGYRLLWSVDKRHVQYFRDNEIPFVTRLSLSWLIYMSKATLWITNCRLPLWIPKAKGTTYLQTWHGTPLKRLANDMDEVHMPSTNTEQYKKNFILEADKWDFLVSPNRYSSDIFKRAFQFNRNLLETGYPRNDFLYSHNNESDQTELKQRLGIPLDKKVIFYAPTWRDNDYHAQGKYKFSLQFDCDEMYSALSEDYVIILRLHYLIADNLDLSKYKGFFYDFSKHDDIRDLYTISDMLITDYSSVFFDFANLKRPMIFYVYDIENYRDNLRGFYIDFEREAPGPLVKTTSELISEINHCAGNNFNDIYNTQEFRDRFCYLEDGTASQKVSDEIIRHLQNKII